MNNGSFYTQFEAVQRNGQYAIDELSDFEKANLINWTYSRRLDELNACRKAFEVNTDYPIPQKFKGAEIEYFTTIMLNFQSYSKVLLLLLFDKHEKAKLFYYGVVQHFRTQYYDAIDALIQFIDGEIQIVYKAYDSIQDGNTTIRLKAFTTISRQYSDLELKNWEVLIHGFPAYLWKSESDRGKLVELFADSVHKSRIEPVKDLIKLFEDYFEFKLEQMQRSSTSSLLYSSAANVKVFFDQENADLVNLKSIKTLLPFSNTDTVLFLNGCEQFVSWLAEKTKLDTSIQQQTEKPKPEPKETELSQRVKKHFGFFNRNCPRKHKQILNDTNFEKLIEWTIWYFENDFKVPEISEPIKVVNTNKTFVQLAFKYLFKEFHKSSPYPETLFEFYQRAFTPYSEDRKSNFEAVKNNDEVKKLMQIDY